MASRFTSSTTSEHLRVRRADWATMYRAQPSVETSPRMRSRPPHHSVSDPSHRNTSAYRSGLALVEAAVLVDRSISAYAERTTGGRTARCARPEHLRIREADLDFGNRSRICKGTSPRTQSGTRGRSCG